MSDMPKMRICVITTVAFTLRVFLLEQLVFLSRNGFEVTIICNYDRELIENCPKELTYYPIAIDRTTSIYSTLLGFYQLYKILINHKFDIVQYCTPKAALIASLSSWLSGIDIRLYCQWGIRYVGMQGLGRYIMKKIEKVTCLFSTHILPDSYGNLELSVSEGLYAKDKASVIHFGSANGVEMTRFNLSKRDEWRKEIYTQLGINDAAFILGWVGRVTKDKGVGELITSFIEVAILDSSIHLIMVGPMEVCSGLSAEVIENIYNHPRIHYVSEQRKVEKYYAAMDIFVAPSYREGFGSVALEAQAMGLPVIATDIPGTREALVNGKTGILVPVRDTLSLITSIIKLKDNVGLRKIMGEEGVKYVQEHFEQNMFWEKVLEHRLEVIKRANT